MQRRPMPQGALLPHRHDPRLHVSADGAVQAWQVIPLEPQAPASAPDTHLPPVQQPAQVVGSQTQVELLHISPGGQAGPVPQAQLPLAHWLARRVSQLRQTVPPSLKQVGKAGLFAQELPLQQPLTQLPGVQSETQTPPGHRPPQMPQSSPFAPHAAGSSPATQVPSALQQPFGQLDGEHAHDSFVHAAPTAHWGLLPHLHAPSLPQALARVGSQLAQVSPWVPQLATPFGWQRSPSQQPSGQLAGVH